MSDPGIILQAGNIQGPDPNNLVSMFSLAQQVQAAKQETAKKNALLSAFSDPNSVDATTGAPTPAAIRKVMAVDPEMGLKLQDDALGAQVKRAQATHYQTEAGKNNFDFMSSTAGIGYDAYDAAKKSGKSEPDAIAAGQTARNDAVKNNGGVIGDDIADGILSKPFDPAGAKALALSNKEWAGAYNQAQTQDRQAKHDETMEDLTRRGQNIRIDTSQAGKWQLLTDPKTQTQYRYNPETTEATTLDGKPYSPGGAQKMASGTAPRSAAAAYIQKFMQENPNASSDEIAKKASQFNEGQSEGRTIGQRSGAADVASQEVDVFARQAMDASKDVPREKLKHLNALIQAGKTEDSDPNLQKLLIATDALVNARARAISPSGQPHVGDQIEGRRLLSTLIGKDGYEAGVQQFLKEAQGVRQSTKQSRDEFFGKGDAASSANIKTVETKDAYDALPKGAFYTKPGDAAGTHRVKQ